MAGRKRQIMAEKQRERPLIEYQVVKPFVDAAALGSGCALVAAASNGPIANWAFIGGAFSLFWHWGSANFAKEKKLAAPRNSSRRKVKVNGEDWTFHHQIPGQFIGRETVWEAVARLIGKKLPKPTPQADFKPPAEEKREFVFRSYCNRGAPFELTQSEVVKFLRTAWLYRDRGRGLGQRFWVREANRRPDWYHQIGGIPAYFAFLNLLSDAEKINNNRLVIVMGHQQVRLKYDDHKTFKELYKAEWRKLEMV